MAKTKIYKVELELTEREASALHELLALAYRHRKELSNSGMRQQSYVLAIHNAMCKTADFWPRIGRKIHIDKLDPSAVFKCTEEAPYSANPKKDYKLRDCVVCKGKAELRRYGPDRVWAVVCTKCPVYGISARSQISAAKLWNNALQVAI